MITGIKIKRADGTWSGGGVPPDVQDFTSSGTWNKPDNAKWVLIETVDGGPGGDAYYYDTTDGWVGGSSRLGGRYRHIMVIADAVPNSLPVTVGANGVGGIYQSGSSGAKPGSAGGTSSVGTVFPSGYPYSSDTTLAAGAGGANRYSNTMVAGKLGGTIAGQYGLLKAGNGGNSSGRTPDVAAQVGGAPGGAGGSGTWNVLGNGANGAPGAVRITTYF